MLVNSGYLSFSSTRIFVALENPILIRRNRSCNKNIFQMDINLNSHRNTNWTQVTIMCKSLIYRHNVYTKTFLKVISKSVTPMD